MTNRRIVGLWSGHDASFCVLNNGIPEIHAELERYTRVKESFGDSIEAFNQRHGVTDGLVGLATCHSADGIKKYSNSWQGIAQLAPLYVCGHHQAHAASAFYSSNFDEATIVTIDGGGIETSDGFNVTVSAWAGSNTRLEHVAYAPISAVNIGGVWSRCTRYIFRYESGWPQGHQAGTVMALAALGDPEKYVNDFRQMLSGRLSEAIFQPEGHVKGMSAKDPRSPRHPFLGKWEDIANASDQGRYDLAAGLQRATEDSVRSILRNALALKPSKNLCLAGGVMLNSVVVGKIRSWFPELENVYVPPVPHDGGLTIGAAQYAWHHKLGNPRIDWEGNFSPYLGYQYSSLQVNGCIARFVSQGRISVTSASDDDVINRLQAGEIISVFNGKAESGRRALGNRSILADPRRPDAKALVNEKVKHRQWFRPFAPSCTRESVGELFTSDVDSPYMSTVLQFRQDVKDKLPAVVHFDGSARVQTVTRDDNPWYHGFLTKWGEASGFPIILNTSFNDREPICETPDDAIKCFLGTDIDCLYFPQFGLLVSKIVSTVP